MVIIPPLARWIHRVIVDLATRYAASGVVRLAALLCATARTTPQHHSAFKSAEDVKKVPELEAARVEARKDRLVC